MHRLRLQQVWGVDMATDVYIRLSYDEYKEMEEQLANYQKLETNHISVDGYYHKSFRLKVGGLLFEFQGPLVKRPLEG